MLRDGQHKIVENLTTIPNPLTAMPGFDAMRKQQEAFMKTMMGGLPWAGVGAKPEEGAADAPEDLAEIKRQVAELQKKLSKL